MVAAGLNPYQLVRYRTRGYVAVRKRFGPSDVAVWRAECDRLWDAVIGQGDGARIQYRGHDNGEAIPDRIDPLLDISSRFRRLARDPRILDTVRSALGGAAIVMKGKLIAKRPGTHGYGTHQDFPYWKPMGVPADHLLTVQVAVDPSTPETGGVEFWPAHHLATLPAPPDRPLDVDEHALAGEEPELIPLGAGDLLLFHSLAPHRSAANRSQHSRRAIFLTYARAEYEGIAEKYATAGLARG